MSLADALQRFVREHREDPALRVVRGTPQSDEMTELAPATPATHQARVVEGAALEQKPVPALGGSGFTHFLDGIQRSRVALIWHGVPVIWGYAAACVRERGADRLMRLAPGMCESREALIFPFAFAPPEELQRWGLACVDSSPMARVPEDADNPAYIRQYSLEMLGDLRRRLERTLLKRWLESSGEGQWLLVDGELPDSEQEGGLRRVVGLIKSHQTRYFAGEEQRMLLELPEGQRTTVFQPHRHGYRPVYSWYLRLRDSSGQDQAFGLVRVEARADEETLRMAGEISGWLLAERTPLSLPDARWDRMIYPVRDCEQYLRSIAPTAVEMDARLQV
ncbi:MAG: hypothetical protein WHZ52_10040 [Armatimonadota bacterium]